MSIFDKFKKSKEEEEAISKKEDAKVNIAKKETETSEIKKVDNKKEVKKSTTAKTSNKSYGVLVRPLITEKATNLGQINQYVFEVSTKANKIQVAQAIEAKYGVKPVKVNILNNSGKIIRRGRDVGKTKDWKKAIVSLPEGKNIQIHEGA